MEALKCQRAVLKSRNTRMKNFLDATATNPDKIGEVSARLEKYEQTLVEFEDVQLQIEQQDPNQANSDEWGTFEDIYYANIAKATAILNTISEKSPTTSPAPSEAMSSTRQACVKLPTLELPSFTGEFSEWLSFRDIFTTLIHENEAINSVQKLHYLKISLKGSASAVLASLPTTSTNYDIAWKLVQTRYENKRILIKTHIDLLLDMSPISEESASSIRTLVDNVTKSVGALTSLQQPTKEWGVLLLYIVLRKLDQGSRRAWEMMVSSEEPTFDDLLTFLSDRARVLETINYTATAEHPASIKPELNSFAATYVKCYDCSGNHKIFSCYKFTRLTPAQRLSRVAQLKLCENCLQTGHGISNCKAGSCRKCGARHHTLLHTHTDNRAAQPRINSEADITNSPPQALSAVVRTSHQVLLSTALVNVISSDGQRICARALLDSGSQASFITEDLHARLGISASNQETTILGIGGSSACIARGTHLSVESLVNKFRQDITCFVLPSISQNIPSYSFDMRALNIPSNIPLADPFFNESAKIDMLLGADIFYTLMCDERKQLGSNLPILQRTVLGWIVGGQFETKGAPASVTCNLVRTLDEQLTRFWAVEDIVEDTTTTAEDRICEEHFIRTTKRAEDGRFIVNMALRDGELGESYPMALRRLHSMERRFRANPELFERYSDFMREYETLGHMRYIGTVDDGIGNYLPHHAVVNENSVSTKLRVVYDASAPTSNGTSLNDLQYCGATLQDDLLDIVIRFRQYRWVIVGDVTKMFRQVLIDPKQRHLQRVLWRENPYEPVKIYELSTVTYGQKSSSYLAVRCLRELSNIYKAWLPRAADAIYHDFYVDDYISGDDDLDQLIQTRNDVTKILKSAGFELRKWMSNSKALLDANEECDTAYELDPDTPQKALGLTWTPNTDVLRFVINVPEVIKRPTKRTVLSTAAKIFDPLGIVSPATIVARIMLQTLWSLKLDWDQPIPDIVVRKWVDYCRSLPELRNLAIPRQAVRGKIVEIHGFSDASEKAYAACIYLKSLDDAGCSTVRLLCSRSRVAPLKALSVPRLELCAAVLLAELYKRVKRALNLEVPTHLWTDSTIVLAWLRTESRQLSTFVGNRVSRVQRYTDITVWRHVATLDNPADLASRGVCPTDLVNSSLWWNGPDWLKLNSEMWECLPGDVKLSNDIPEMRLERNTLLAAVEWDLTITSRYSSLNKLLRVTAYCLRFGRNCKKSAEKRTGTLTASDISSARHAITRLVQLAFFPAEINALQRNLEVSQTSRLRQLAPFIDANGILRVGGRLRRSNLPFDEQHPCILPTKSDYTTLVVRAKHERLLHAGPQQTHAEIRREFWIIAGRGAVRRVTRACIPCFQAKPIPLQQLMADLPIDRVTPYLPFTVCGVDYAGPLQYVESHRRGNHKLIRKAYFAVFVCFSTRAVHLELVSDLTSEAFLACFRRFIARRATCRYIYSDNGTNFVGAANHLNKFLKETQHNEEVAAFFTGMDIQWKFIPPRSPHHGGLWEAAVKSVKNHIKRTIGETLLTFEEFSTLLCQVESVLNSRPLTALSSDPSDLEPLTPFHFLVGTRSNVIPEPNLSDTSAHFRSRWRLIQLMRDRIWKRWSQEYLHELQQRSKWRTSCESLKVGDLVLLTQESAPSFCWPTGRVVELHSGSDGKVRVVSIRTVSGITKRAITKLCKLPIESDVQ